MIVCRVTPVFSASCSWVISPWWKRREQLVLRIRQFPISYPLSVQVELGQVACYLGGDGEEDDQTEHHQWGLAKGKAQIGTQADVLDYCRGGHCIPLAWADSM